MILSKKPLFYSIIWNWISHKRSDLLWLLLWLEGYSDFILIVGALGGALDFTASS